MSQLDHREPGEESQDKTAEEQQSIRGARQIVRREQPTQRGIDAPAEVEESDRESLNTILIKGLLQIQSRLSRPEKVWSEVDLLVERQFLAKLLVLCPEPTDKALQIVKALGLTIQQLSPLPTFHISEEVYLQLSAMNLDLDRYATRSRQRIQEEVHKLVIKDKPKFSPRSETQSGEDLPQYLHSTESDLSTQGDGRQGGEVVQQVDGIAEHSNTEEDIVQFNNLVTAVQLTMYTFRTNQTPPAGENIVTALANLNEFLTLDQQKTREKQSGVRKIMNEWNKLRNLKDTNEQPLLRRFTRSQVLAINELFDSITTYLT